jgi:hypothetical protein
MRVYAVCRNCAEVHHASIGCPRCQRRALAIGSSSGRDAGGRDSGGGDFGDLGESTPLPSVPRAEPTALIASGRRSRRWWLSTILLAAYLVAIVGLLAAVLFGRLADS